MWKFFAVPFMIIFILKLVEINSSLQEVVKELHEMNEIYRNSQS